MLFAGWRQELAICRKYAPAARNYAAARLMAEAGLRVNETSHLDLDDIKWDLGRFGKLHVRQGKGARGSRPRERMVPLINGAGATLGHAWIATTMNYIHVHATHIEDAWITGQERAAGRVTRLLP